MTPSEDYGLVARSKAMLEIAALVDKLAACDISVCIHGGPGTGKSFVSRIIHDRSQRRSGPFIALDCRRMPPKLQVRHLFGEVEAPGPGEAAGIFGRARSGTLLLEEPTALQLDAQVKLLQVLRSGECRASGTAAPVRADVRLITTMTGDPKQAVDRRILIEDLYYRMAVVLIKLPPLRERPDDIPPLVDQFLRQMSRRCERSVSGVAPEALARMMELPWPGNVHQLEDVLDKACATARGGILTERELFPEARRLADGPASFHRQ